MLVNDSSQGFREIEHTADWELHIWAPNLVALFEEAAGGMYKLSGTLLESRARVARSLKSEQPTGSPCSSVFYLSCCILGRLKSSVLMNIRFK